MLNKRGLLGILVLLVCLLLMQGRVLALPNSAPSQQEVIPAYYYGTVLINGANVPLETVVSAWIGGVRYDKDSLTYLNEFGVTAYFLEVPADNLGTTGVKEGGVSGEIVSFKIGAVDAQTQATVTWVQGGPPEPVHLTATVVVATATPTQTFTPSLTRTVTATATPSLTPTITATTGPATVTPTVTPSFTRTSTPTLTETATRTPTRTTPTATAQPRTVTIAGIQDTYLDATYHDQNFAASGYLGMTSSSEGGSGQRPILRFDLEGAGIPAGSTVIAATMSLRTYPAGSNTVPQTVGAYALRRAWVVTEATWGRASASMPWASAGADMVNVDRGASPYDEKIINNANYALYEWNITALAGEWAQDSDEQPGRHPARRSECDLLSTLLLGGLGAGRLSSASGGDLSSQPGGSDRDSDRRAGLHRHPYRDASPDQGEQDRQSAPGLDDLRVRARQELWRFLGVAGQGGQQALSDPVRSL